ncbi:MAG TPA: ABATE domain-containing protein, partial [Actinomycetota bacterium]
SFPELWGGVACLDFANTLDGRATEQPEENLQTYADVVKWATYAGLLDEEAAVRISDASRDERQASDPGEASEGKASDDGRDNENLRTALELREAIFGIFSAVGRHQPVPEPALDSLQQHFAQAMAHAHLDDRRGWYFTGADPGRAWWPIAVDAVTLLTHGPLDRVKVCAAEAGCVGLFLDTSKNRSRRWCTMDGCGVDAKVKRQAQRRRSARPRTAPE